ncbi:diacylglycerol kinase family enzyme [Rhizomicrobium palustre]|uniref:Diacylglycerol kinase family enzyme n=1 Tax=Rhizomicrobium palustre TaxID=189966 RepID=A0A846MUS4_9PROT|nr:diacylglycerol kinase family protein [Rhizomicrobium palustre]NIK87268.1 diacylglycerol kinase family enzyme [Rhizomicrobium palustre]
MVPERIDLKAAKIGAVVNRSSGSADMAAGATMLAILDEAGIKPAAMEAVHGSEVDAALTKLAASDLDVLIVLGGDGTIRTAAEKCSKSGMGFIALPGGTMNMLPRALYGEQSWPDALRETVAAPAIAHIGAGEVEGHRFFCAGIFGPPAHWAEAREALRESRVSEAFRRAINAWRRSFSGRIRYSFSLGKLHKATAVSVICPLISKVMPSDAPALEAAALTTRDLGEAFSLALSGLFADWRLAAQVRAVATRELLLTARRPIPALLDGERVTLPRTTEVRFVPNAFKALVPQTSPVLAARHEEAV